MPRKTTDISKRAFTEAEAAAYIGRSRSYLAHGRSRGAISNRNSTPTPPYTRQGRHVLYLREDLDAWIDALPKHQNLAEELVADASSLQKLEVVR